MTFLLALLANPVFRRIGKYALVAMAVGIAALWFIHHERNIGAAKCEAAVKVATDAERARETGINQNWQQWAAGAVQNADTQKAIYDKNLRAIATATADDRATCLFSPTADKLRAIGRPRGKADPRPASSGVKR